jgi:hypothetical protein
VPGPVIGGAATVMSAVTAPGDGAANEAGT